MMLGIKTGPSLKHNQTLHHSLSLQLILVLASAADEAHKTGEMFRDGKSREDTVAINDASNPHRHRGRGGGAVDKA